MCAPINGPLCALISRFSDGNQSAGGGEELDSVQVQSTRNSVKVAINGGVACDEQKV